MSRIVTDLVVKRGKNYICYYLHAGEDRLGELNFVTFLAVFDGFICCVLVMNISHARTQVSLRFSNLSSLVVKRNLTIRCGSVKTGRKLKKRNYGRKRCNK